MRLQILIITAVAVLTGCSGGGGGGNNNQAPAPAADNPPTISQVADQTIEANSSSRAIPITVGDDQTDADALVLVARSDNTSLVPEEGLALSGGGTDRSLVITPVADASGTATITVTVTDERSQSAETAFLVTVTPAGVSFSNFVRAVFGTDANAPPFEVNAIEFDQDAGDFDDLVVE